MHQPFPSKQTDLQEATHAFTYWRNNKPTKRAHVPEDLWKLACHEAKTHAIVKAPREVKLDCCRLKQQCNGHAIEAAASSTVPTAFNPQRPSSTPPAFVKLPLVAIGGANKCAVELATGQRTRFVLRWRGSNAPGLAVLGQLLAQRR